MQGYLLFLAGEKMRYRSHKVLLEAFPRFSKNFKYYIDVKVYIATIQIKGLVVPKKECAKL